MKSRTKRRLGTVAFLVPFVVVFGVFAFTYYGSISNTTGVLVVEAQSSYGASSKFIHVQATVNGITQTTPFNATLNAGTYTVSYASIGWYYHAANRTVGIPGGKVVYAVGVFNPIPDYVGATQTGFNVTRVNAGAGITPVVFQNVSGQPIQLQSVNFNRVIPAMENYTYVFQTSGQYRVLLLGTNANMTVTVT